jgi:hypothetical protein
MYIVVWDPIIKRGGWDQINRSNTFTVLCLSEAMTWNSIDLNWEAVVGFIYIGLIVVHNYSISTITYCIYVCNYIQFIKGNTELCMFSYDTSKFYARI